MFLNSYKVLTIPNGDVGNEKKKRPGAGAPERVYEKLKIIS